MLEPWQKQQSSTTTTNVKDLDVVQKLAGSLNVHRRTLQITDNNKIRYDCIPNAFTLLFYTSSYRMTVHIKRRAERRRDEMKPNDIRDEARREGKTKTCMQESPSHLEVLENLPQG